MMSFLTYEQNPDGKISVKLFGKTLGHICKVDGGYAYKAKGLKVYGETFKTIAAVKKTLEAD